MSLSEYVNFYKELKTMNELKNDFEESMYKLNLFNKDIVEDKDKLDKLFFEVNEKRVSIIKNKFVSLFNITNFCYSNRWGSYDCIIFEHNSNALPWRETGAKIVYIDNDENNDFSFTNLEEKLKLHKANIIKIGTFSAASNITGVYLDVDYISLLLHQYNALGFYDYATASPYVKIDMNKALPVDYREKLGFKKRFNPEEEKLIYKDSLFFSPHKFVGGPNTPGVLIIKQHVVRNLLIPSEPGGGVVLFVRKEQQK